MEELSQNMQALLQSAQAMLQNIQALLEASRVAVQDAATAVHTDAGLADVGIKRRRRRKKARGRSGVIYDGTSSSGVILGSEVNVVE